MNANELAVLREMGWTLNQMDPSCYRDDCLIMLDQLLDPRANVRVEATSRDVPATPVAVEHTSHLLFTPAAAGGSFEFRGQEMPP